MRAMLNMRSQDINAAIDDLNHALEVKPNDAETYDQRANYRMFVRQNELALKDYDAAISFGLKTEKVYTGRARVKADMGDYQAAIADYQTAIGVRPLFAAAHIGLAHVYERQGKTEQAIAHLENFLNQYEDYKKNKLPTVKGENFGDTVIIKREGAEKDGSQVFLSGTQRRVEIKANTPEELKMRTDQMEQRMNVAGAYLNLASMLIRQKSYDKALAAIEKSLEMNRGDWAALNTRGKILLEKGDINAAFADLDAAVRINSRNFSLYADRGIALLMQGKDAEAQQDFDRFLQMFPNGKDNLNKRIEEAKAKRAVQQPQQQ
jgi:tetratricopeptide (TPR) repeat protein